MDAIILSIPSNYRVLNKQNKTVGKLNYNQILSRMFFEIQPDIKVFNSIKLDISKTINIIQKFIRDYNSKIEFFNDIKSKLVNSAFVKCSVKFAQLNPDKIGVEVTNSKTIYFFIRKDQYKIHFEVFFNHQLETEPFECVLNVFDCNNPILNASGSFDYVFESLSQLIPNDKEIYLDYIDNSSQYGISERTFAKSWL